MARQKTESELKLRSLRQEHDRVKTGLQRQLERLGGTVGGGGGSGGGVVRRSLTSRGGDVGAGTGRSAARGSGAGVGAGTGVRGSQQQQVGPVRVYFDRGEKGTLLCSLLGGVAGLSIHVPSAHIWLCLKSVLGCCVL